MKACKLATVLTVVVTPLLAQWINLPTPGIPRTADGKPNLTAPTPRASDGKPDLTGLWAMRNFASDLKAADVQPWAQALLKQRAEELQKDNPRFLCLPEGPLYSTRGVHRIVQTPAMIVILNTDLTFRQIFLDGRPLEADPNPDWMGYAVGHWDGDTLVVESAGFNDRTWLSNNGLPHTEALRMTERYRRTNFGSLEVEVTFRDPGVSSKAWTTTGSAGFDADTELLTEVCNEGNAGREHWIGRASDNEKSAVKVAPEVLAKYVGVYKGIWASRPRTVEFTLAGATLYAAVNGGGKLPVIPHSETSFAGAGVAYDFVSDERGVVTDVIEAHVSGDYKFARQK